MDPMQALDALAQAGVPPELLQQIEQALGGGGGGMPPGGGGMPPPGGGMACGGLAHMAGGGATGAYGIDPEMIKRLMAASGGRNPMGGQSANPMAPGHMGSGAPGMGMASNASGPMSLEEARRRKVQTQMHSMAHGGLAHMSGGGGAYGIDPAMLARIKAQGNPFGGQSANPMAPGHMGAGRPGMSNMGGDPNNVVNERRRREAMLTGRMGQ